MKNELKTAYLSPRVKYLDLDLEQMIAASLGELPVDPWIDDDF